MGRAPCCDKANVKKGPWSPEEDAKLKAYIEQHGTGGNWIALPQKIGLKRCGKSCRLRWLNYLRPNIKHGGFSEEEDNIICSLYISIGSRWSIIAAQLPGRTDNDIKNYWNTRLKKKLLGKQRKEHQARKASCNLKQQEMRKDSGNLALSASGSQNHYYLPPETAMPSIMPNLPYPNDHQDLIIPINDQASIRKLLIKLGERFSSDHHHQQQQQQLEDNIHDCQNTNNLQNPLDFSPTQHRFYDDIPNNSSIPSSAASMNSMTNSSSQLLLNYINGQYDLDIAAASVHMLQGINNNFQFHHQFDHDIAAYSNINSERIEGLLECNNMPNGCCSGSTTNTTTGPISAESASWDGIMAPLAYFQTGSAEFDRVQPGMLQAVAYNAFEESRHIG